MGFRNKIILIGGGGHCSSVIDVIEKENKFVIAGIVDKPELLGQKVLDYSVIACDSDIPKLVTEVEYFFITIGHIESNELRVKLFENIISNGGRFPVIISPLSYVSKHSKILEGTIVMHHAVVNANAFIGRNSIVNTGSAIEHDVKIGDHCHVSTGVFVNGNCRVGNNCFIGSGSTIIQGVVVGEGAFVGAGSVVLKDASPLSKIVGNPAKSIK